MGARENGEISGNCVERSEHYGWNRKDHAAPGVTDQEFVVEEIEQRGSDVTAEGSRRYDQDSTIHGPVCRRGEIGESKEGQASFPVFSTEPRPITVSTIMKVISYRHEYEDPNIQEPVGCRFIGCKPRFHNIDTHPSRNASVTAPERVALRGGVRSFVTRIQSNFSK